MKNSIQGSYKIFIEKYRSQIYIFILTIVGFSLYYFSLKNILFLDDKRFILNNEYIWGINWQNIKYWFTENSFAGGGGVSDYYRPFLLFSFAMNYAIDGIRPLGYHLVNNFIHIINSILVFWVALRYIFKKHWQSFLLALFFLVHPMQSEAVAYVSGRGDLLASLFMFIGLIFWFKSFENKKKIYYTLLSLVFLILALLSRENAIVFPFLAMVFYISFISKENLWFSIKNAFFKVIPHLLVVGTYFVLRLTVLNFRNFLNFGNFESGSLYKEYLSIRLFTFGHALLEYMKTLFYPTNVYLRLYFPISQSFFLLPVLVAFLGVVLIFIALVSFYRKEKDTTSLDKVSSFKIWLFCWGWFFVALSPASGVIPVNVIIQDHRLYLAMIGIFSLLIYYLEILFNYLKLNNLKWVIKIIVFFLVIYICFFISVTIKRIFIWGKPNLLFEETLRYEPSSSGAYSFLGSYYFDQEDYLNAEKNFLIAIEKGTTFPQVYYAMGDLRDVSGTKKDVNEAILFYKKSIEIDPNFKPPYRRLAEIYMERGNVEAVFYLKKLNQFDPKDANIHYNLALILNYLKDKDEALKWLGAGRLLIGNNESAKKAFDDLEMKILSSQQF